MAGDQYSHDVLCGRLEPDANGKNNLDFVCHSRTDIPALVEIAKVAESHLSKIMTECSRGDLTVCDSCSDKDQCDAKKTYDQINQILEAKE